MENFTFRLYIDTRYKNNNPQFVGKFEVKVRVTSKHTHKLKLIKTGIYTTPEIFYSLFPEYATRKMRLKKSFAENISAIANREENQLLKDSINTFYMELKNADTPETRTHEQLLSNIGYKKGTTQFVDWVNNYCKRDIAESNRKRVIASQKKLQKFFNELNKSKTPLSLYDITPTLLNKWERWMLEDEGHTLGTTIDYSADIRKVVNLAVNSKDCDYNKESYPFYLKGINEDGYIIKEDNEKPISNYLNDVDFDKFLNYEPQSDLEEIAKDLWLFSYYSAGTNIKDIFNLKWTQIDYENNKILYYRKKTKRQKRQVAKPVMLSEFHKEIIERYKGKREFALNFHSKYKDHKALNDQITKQLKKIALKLDISSKFNMMSARNSSFSNLSKHATPEEIMNTLGTHSKVKTLKGYIKKLNANDKVDDMFSKLHKS